MTQTEYTIFAYCLCDEVLKTLNHRDHPQARLTTAEVMTVVLVAAAFYGGNWEHARLYLWEHGFIPQMLSQSRLCRRIHAVPPDAWQVVFSVLAALHQHAEQPTEFLVDSLPIPVCANIRIRRCRLYQGEAYRGYIPAKRVFFYGLRIHLLVTASGRPVEVALAAGGKADIEVFQTLVRELPAGSTVIGDKGYTSATEEAVCAEAEQLVFCPLRRRNMRAQRPAWAEWYLGSRRRRVETGFSVLCQMLPRSVHAVSSRGFELKVYAFVIAYSIRCL
ncbi:MAG: IS982 family transposase [Fimbriimonadales bacterium]|nr:IS982 family transposase [Fimbriimonadales bacterium]